ncbi:MAG: ATP-binding protein [Roseburia sp.]|nr:ATP-binding protein [Roseburia sp.]
MFELALYILDISQNSVAAAAKHIDITVSADTARDILSVTIKDDGKGMDGEFLAKVTDPFTTSRTTRKVGMGLPLFKMEAEKTGGSFSVTSEVGKGTVVNANFVLSSVDRLPLGDLGSCMSVLIAGGGYETTLRFSVDDRTYIFDTAQIKRELGADDLSEPVVVNYLEAMIDENIQSVKKGVYL